MTSDQINENNPNQSEVASLEVAAAVRAMIAARDALVGPTPRPVRASLVTVRGTDGSISTVRARGAMANEQTVGPEQLAVSELEPRCVPTPEAIRGAQEAALAGFPESVQAAARAALEQSRFRTAGKLPVKAYPKDLVRPWPIPSDLPQRRPEVVVSPFPAAALDDPDVREEWAMAHRNAAEARFLMQPAVIKAYAEAQLACEKWDAKERGRKPSGDLRHPVPRNRLDRIVAELTDKQATAVARAERTIHAIESGDVVGVEVDEGFQLLQEYRVAVDGKRCRDRDYSGLRVVTLVLQSELDRKAALQRAKDNRTPEQVEAENVAWERMIEDMVANLPPDSPALEVPNLPELPTHREPTEGELWAVSNAIRKHTRYLERGAQIEAQRLKDAETKVHNRAKREAEKADPEGTAAAKQAAKLSKSAERQRRWRERQKAAKNTTV